MSDLRRFMFKSLIRVIRVIRVRNKKIMMSFFLEHESHESDESLFLSCAAIYVRFTEIYVQKFNSFLSNTNLTNLTNLYRHHLGRHPAPQLRPATRHPRNQCRRRENGGRCLGGGRAEGVSVGVFREKKC